MSPLSSAQRFTTASRPSRTLARGSRRLGVRRSDLCFMKSTRARASGPFLVCKSGNRCFIDRGLDVCVRRGEPQGYDMSTTSRSSPAMARANGIELCYDAFGDRNAAPLILIMGLAAQMIAWDEAFCAQLADRGFWAVRFDNRDIGLSTRLQQFPVPDLASLIEQQLLGEPLSAPYTLRDMAADTVGLMDALGIESAHVVGVSMGGAIAQEMAIHYPNRVRTLTSIMSSTG